MNNESRVIQCTGAGKHPNDEKCPCGVDGWHKVVKSDNDTRPYNGIKYWRCPQCFEAHRTLIRKK